MKEFIIKWSIWWMLNKHRQELDVAFERELKELIQQEVAKALKEAEK